MYNLWCFFCSQVDTSPKPVLGGRVLTFKCLYFTVQSLKYWMWSEPYRLMWIAAIMVTLISAARAVFFQNFVERAVNFYNFSRHHIFPRTWLLVKTTPALICKYFAKLQRAVEISATEYWAHARLDPVRLLTGECEVDNGTGHLGPCTHHSFK